MTVMTLPADRNLNDTPPCGPLTAADFDTYQSPETAMLLHDDFKDTIALPRRQPKMDFVPEWYEAAHAASEIDDDASEALRKKVRGARFGFAALLVSAAIFIAGIAGLASLY